MYKVVKKAKKTYRVETKIAQSRSEGGRLLLGFSISGELVRTPGAISILRTSSQKLVILETLERIATKGVSNVRQSQFISIEFSVEFTSIQIELIEYSSTLEYR